MSQLGRSWGDCLLGLSPCSLVIPAVLSGKEVASSAVAPEAPWLGLRLWPAWERAPALPALLPSWWGTSMVCLGMSTCTPSLLGGLTLPVLDWAPTLPALLPGWGVNAVFLGLSTFPPSQLGGSAGWACATAWLRGVNATCLGMSAHPACHCSQLGGSAGWACTTTWLRGVRGDAWASYISFLL